MGVGGLPDLLQYYMGVGGVPKLYYVIYEQPLNGLLEKNRHLRCFVANFIADGFTCFVC